MRERKALAARRSDSDRYQELLVQPDAAHPFAFMRPGTAFRKEAAGTALLLSLRYGRDGATRLHCCLCLEAAAWLRTVGCSPRRRRLSMA
jgi:hypothetical protein